MDDVAEADDGFSFHHRLAPFAICVSMINALGTALAWVGMIYCGSHVTGALAALANVAADLDVVGAHSQSVQTAVGAPLT